ncbi:MAG: hypothetical protein ACOC03_04725 [Desulfosalsimonas sp.]
MKKVVILSNFTGSGLFLRSFKELMWLENADICLAADIGVCDFHKTAVVSLGFKLPVNDHIAAVFASIRVVVYKSLVIDVIKKGQIVSVKFFWCGGLCKPGDIKRIKSCNIIYYLFILWFLLNK